tara:strand:- start:544 stop:729 length:186 start_codon:yes stop_codon:yes gene_type:complete
MEIPTKEIIEKLQLIAIRSRVVSHAATALDGIDVIEAQALEIRELQAVINRVRQENALDKR